MNGSELTAMLFGPGLPVSGYASSSHGEDERDAMVSMVEVEDEGAIWLVTRPGHFAHPSLLRTWVEQFRTQDRLQRGL